MAGPARSAKDIFLEAVERPAEQWAGFVADACGGNAELQKRVEALLKAHAEAGSIPHAEPLSPATGDFVPSMSEESAGAGLSIGPYKLLQKLGEGGMGVVWLADQEQPVRRRVALKVIKAGMDSAQVLARFEAERQALALMDHPNIAKVLDAGCFNDRPYVVMELVKGVPITKYCDQVHLTPKERLELFIPVCQAVQHAHQKGIIHRDLKPSNVIVGLYDGKPIPKVIDFGVAKATSQRLTERTMFTEVGQIVGTLEYMAPEQAELNNLDVDTRADIYSLGVILYELLAGSPPFTRKQFESAAFSEMLRMIKEVEPQKPSTKLSSSHELATIAANRHLEPKRLTRLLHGDLDWIVMKCLEKERARRYETANGLAMELQRYLADEPVMAGPPSRLYRMRKFVRKNKVAFATLLGFVVMLTAATAVSSWQAYRAKRAENDARNAWKEEAERRAEAIAAEQRAKAGEADTKAVLSYFQERVLAAARPREQQGGLGVDVTVRAAVDAAEPLIATSFRDRPEVEASIRHVLGVTYRLLGEADRAVIQLERSRDIRTKKLSPDHDDVLHGLMQLGLAYQKAGRLNDAIKQLTLARDRFLARSGPADAATLRAQLDLAGVYVAASRLTEAISTYEEVLRLIKEHHDKNHTHYQSCLHESATAYRAAGRIADAVPLYEEAWRLGKERYGPTHPEVGVCVSNLAMAYYDVGRPLESLPYFEEAVRLARMNLPADHPDLLRCLNNLAMAFTFLGRGAESVPILDELLQKRTAKLGRDHPDTLYSINNLGHGYLNTNRAAEALPLFEEVVRLRKEKIGEEHHDTQISIGNLATVYDALGRTPEAIPIYKQLLANSLKRFGPDHPNSVNFAHNLALAYLIVNQLDDAVKLEEENLKRSRAFLGEDHPIVGYVSIGMGRIYDGRNELQSAEPHYRKAADIFQAKMGPDHPNRANALTLLGRNLVLQSKALDAESVLREALAIREKKLPDGWQTYYTRSTLGACLLGQNKIEPAEPLLIDGFTGMKQRAAKITAPDKFRLTEAAERLVKLYEASGKADDAEKWRKELAAIQAATKPLNP